jgi:hypothetical protein
MCVARRDVRESRLGGDGGGHVPLDERTDLHYVASGIEQFGVGADAAREEEGAASHAARIEGRLREEVATVLGGRVRRCGLPTRRCDDSDWSVARRGHTRDRSLRRYWSRWSGLIECRLGCEPAALWSPVRKYR